ncbi:ribonucleoside triphosphate reductase [Candidatus Woesearchaeota archaeon]|jgi:ribonucleoside-triphosphate reductase (formate)|nr:ribonucleoside triphosphate reductase [Candidatus Woesearchaeota archaeon]MBT6519271.1 ribonucleoside triphosphate reductase [Candidatus Woesearchaeota archaeon]MBT7368463.1 ribonucleoside triphosphate reductase [Candidatus Woesearchaeota archaeon]
MEHLKEIKRVRKRSGELVLYDDEKITEAIFKSVKAAGHDNYDLAKVLTKKVSAILNIFFKGGSIPTVENIQDLIEKVLVEEGHADIAKTFIIYREQRRITRTDQGVLIDVGETMNEYLTQNDWRVNENANVGYSIGGLILNISGKITANYWLNHVYPKEIREAHIKGDYHIHDLSMYSGYCAGWSLRQLIAEGFGGVPGKLQTVPAKHFDTIIGQMVNFLGTLQNEWAGAQAFSSFDTYLAPFIKIDNLDYKKVKQQMQRFLFNIATPSRWGTQTPFINLTLDWVCPEDMKNTPAIIGGKNMDFTYGDCEKEMELINKAFMECMIEGDASGRIFTFPIPTYNITKDFNWDSENAKLLFEMTAKYGIPYFQNFINSSLNPSDVRSMCCRLQMDLRELKSRGGGLFGAAEMTGSIGIVTINLARIGYLSQTKEEYFEKLEKLMDLAKESLEIKRKDIAQSLDKGLFPFTKRYLGSFNNHFSTIGLNGMNESLLNFIGKNVASKEGIAFAKEVLNFMRNKLSNYQEETGHLYNLEATPAEGASYRMAKADKKRYPDIISAGKENPYYTNSTQLPVGYTSDIFEALELQDDLQSAYTGGTVFHGFLGEQISDAETCKQLVKRIAYNFSLPYFTITPTFSVCPDHGYIPGKHETCPYDTTEEIKTESHEEIFEKGRKEVIIETNQAERINNYTNNNNENNNNDNQIIKPATQNATVTANAGCGCETATEFVDDTNTNSDNEQVVNSIESESNQSDQSQEINQEQKSTATVEKTEQKREFNNGEYF